MTYHGVIQLIKSNIMVFDHDFIESKLNRKKKPQQEQVKENLNAEFRRDYRSA